METKEVEMKDEIKETPQEKAEKEKREAFDLMVSDVRNNILLIRRGVQQNDDRLIGRALRQIFTYRKKLDKRALFHIFTQNLVENSDRKQYLLDQFKNIKEEVKIPEANKKLKRLSEIEVFLQILLIVHFIDTKQYKEALTSSSDLIDFIQKQSKTTMNLLASKAYFYYSRSYELNNQFSLIRGTLLDAFRTACLRRDHHGQAMMINLLLRNYISDNLYDQANKLITKSPNIDFHSNSQLARYLYYKGRILSVQLEYGLAYDCLMQAIMKAPTSGARGFRIEVNKLLIIVKLLMGEIPEKKTFTQKGLQKSLFPYYNLTKDVRVGDLLKFKKTFEKFSEIYKKDKTFSLIQRIRQNVIRTGVKKISLSYSKISFSDICEKLHLDNPEDVEHIVSKAIRDGIIDATIDHEKSFMESKESVNVYSTSEPTLTFENRIEFCLGVHNASVKALRYPPTKQSKEEEGKLDEFFDEIIEDDDDLSDGFGI